MLRIGVSGSNHHPVDAGGNDGAGAGRGASVGAAGLQGDKKGGAAGRAAVVQCVAQGLNFRVGLARLMMPTAANDGAAFDEYGAHHGVGERVAVGAAGQAQRQTHVRKIGHRLPVVAVWGS